MKNFYLKVLFVLSAFVLQAILPTGSFAQCTCAGGVPATAIKQVVSIPPTTSSLLSFSFQKFDPTVGTLACLTVFDTISAISYSGARNTNPDSTIFKFLLSVTSEITGPGIDISQDFTKNLGPDTLAPYGDPGSRDTTTYGPLNVISFPTGTASTGGNAAYIGTGNINLNYSINGGLVSTKGGLNYRSAITTTLGGSIALIYYYCPAALLASGLQNFTAIKKDNNIVLKWDAQNSADIDQYEVEYSLDGSSFTSIATVAANHGATFSSYNYNYALNGASSNNVYFRIKQTNSAAKTGYSSIQKVALNNKAGFTASVYPNPVSNNMSIAFDHALNGEFSVDLVNMSGQTVVSRKLKLAGANIIPVNFSSKPAPGVYFTRVTNTSNMEQQIVRTVIQ